MGKGEKIRDVPHMDAAEKIQACVDAYHGPPSVSRSEPLRLIDIEVYRFDLIRAFAWVREGRTDLRQITISEEGARRLVRELLAVLDA